MKMQNILSSILWSKRFMKTIFPVANPTFLQENSAPPSYRKSTNLHLDNSPPPEYPNQFIDHEIVGKTFYLLLIGMKWTGICPLTIQNLGRTYGAPTLSTRLYAIIVSLFITTCVSIYTLNRGFDISWPVRIWEPLRPQEIYDSSSGNRPPPNFFIGVTLGLQVLIPVSTLVYGHLAFYRLTDYSRFLNRWAEYSKLFETYFSPYSYSADFTALRKYKKYYALTYAPVVVSSFILIPYMSTTKVLQVSTGSSFLLSTAMTLFWVEFVMGIRVIFSIKDFMNLHVLEIAYGELRKGIEVQYTVLQGKVNRLHVRNWLKMVVFIRDQRSLVEKHMGLQNNYMLVEIFVVTLLVLTASIVVIMNEINEYFGWVTTYVLISLAFVFFLFFKAQLAEGISDQEELLVEKIVGMTGCDDCETRLEMKSLCDLIFHDPIKITLGYVFVLNKRLILAFCSQLAASLVILLQFVNH